MNKKLSIALALVAGLLGGLLTRCIAPPAALAQDQAPITKEIRAQSFTLVDESDHTVGTFTIDPGLTTILQRPPAPNKQVFVHPPRIVLRDSNGREIWSAGGSPFRQLSER